MTNRFNIKWFSDICKSSKSENHCLEQGCSSYRKLLCLEYAFIFLCYLFASKNVYAIEPETFSDTRGEIFIEKMNSSPFPHPKRETGHQYQGVLYSPEEHYSERVCLFFIPSDLDTSTEVNFVFYFHGWNDSITEISPKYKVISQFFQSNKNAVLVIPQGPYKSPDSFWGNLQETNGFSIFLEEVIDKLYSSFRIQTKKLGQVIISGHSGAYKVISYILMRGGQTESIKEVYLFDGLYGDLEKYVYWAFLHNGKFIHIFTKDKFTTQQSLQFVENLEGWKKEYLFRTEKEIQEKDIQEHKLIFIYSNKTHNTVMHESFKLFLKNSSLPNRGITTIKPKKKVNPAKLIKTN